MPDPVGEINMKPGGGVFAVKVNQTATLSALDEDTSINLVSALSKVDITDPADVNLEEGAVPTYSWQIPAESIDNEEYLVGLKANYLALDTQA